MHHDIPEFTRHLARAAGALIRTEQAALEGLITSFKGGTELVTNADIKADQFICDAIRARFP
ncbi:MAG: inositol monophosphatase, partial [Pseudomonadota bacterium]